jgi:tRNA(His) guanylyltransferase
MKDEIGDRLKSFFEDRTRYLLPRKTYYIIRADGKAFHSYARGLKRPFDEKLMEDMDNTTKYLCENIQGCKLGYVQSDEISLLLTDTQDIKTEAWFDGVVQKIASISASMATAKFNELRPGKIALFDSRVFSIPQLEEVINYFIWRQQDATRNSISSVAQSLYSHKELQGKPSNELQELIFKKGINWDKLPVGQKRGRAVIRVSKDAEVEYTHKKTKEVKKIQVVRNEWQIVDPPVFSKDKTFILNTLK